MDEYYWLNKHDPNYSLCRASEKCGQDAHTDKKFTLDKDSALALSKLFMTPEKDLEDKKISEILPDSFGTRISGYTGRLCLHFKDGHLHWK